MAKWIKVASLIYCGVGISLYLFQKKLIFHPEPIVPGNRFDFDIPFDELLISDSEDQQTSVVRFYPPESPAGLVLFFHGNRGNINRYARYASTFTRFALEVWMIDYPGYGKSTGNITEKAIYRQALDLYKIAAEKYPGDKIIVYGKSLGTAPASFLASKKICRKLILETPFYSMPDLLRHHAPVFPTSILSKFYFPIYKYLSATAAPIVIFHGTKDRVIPYRKSARLKSILKSRDEYYSIEGGNHNNLDKYPIYQLTLAALLSEDVIPLPVEQKC